MDVRRRGGEGVWVDRQSRRGKQRLETGKRKKLRVEGGWRVLSWGREVEAWDDKGKWIFTREKTFLHECTSWFMQTGVQVQFLSPRERSICQTRVPSLCRLTAQESTAEIPQSSDTINFSFVLTDDKSSENLTADILTLSITPQAHWLLWPSSKSLNNKMFILALFFELFLLILIVIYLNTSFKVSSLCRWVL